MEIVPIQSFNSNVLEKMQWTPKRYQIHHFCSPLQTQTPVLLEYFLSIELLGPGDHFECPEILQLLNKNYHKSNQTLGFSREGKPEYPDKTSRCREELFWSRYHLLANRLDSGIPVRFSRGSMLCQRNVRRKSLREFRVTQDQHM